MPEGDISAVGSVPWQAIPATRVGTEEVYANSSVQIDQTLTFLQGYGRCRAVLGI